MAVGMDGTGHFSPVVAFEPESDSALRRKKKRKKKKKKDVCREEREKESTEFAVLSDSPTSEVADTSHDEHIAHALACRDNSVYQPSV